LHFPLRFSAAGRYSYSWRVVVPSPGCVTTCPKAQTQRGVKMRGAVIFPAATVVGGRKNTQIYIIIKRTKKMCSGKCNSRELVFGKSTPPGAENLKILNENAI
jgi:hypothetical protein